MSERIKILSNFMEYSDSLLDFKEVNDYLNQQSEINNMTLDDLRSISDSSEDHESSELDDEWAYDGGCEGSTGSQEEIETDNSEIADKPVDPLGGESLNSLNTNLVQNSSITSTLSDKSERYEGVNNLNKFHTLEISVLDSAMTNDDNLDYSESLHKNINANMHNSENENQKGVNNVTLNEKNSEWHQIQGSDVSQSQNHSCQSICNFELDNLNCKVPPEDRIIYLWNHILKLKYILSNLQLNLKEQKMERLVEINKFLIDQTVKSSNYSDYTILEQLSNCSLCNKNDGYIEETISFNKSSKSLIEDNELMSVDLNHLINLKDLEYNSVKDSVQSNDTNPDLKRHTESYTCCCDSYGATLVCSCLTDGTKSTLPSQSYERKFRSTEEISVTFPVTKCCHSESTVNYTKITRK